jgi:hypothetical protein
MRPGTLSVFPHLTDKANWDLGLMIYLSLQIEQLAVSIQNSHSILYPDSSFSLIIPMSSVINLA